MYIVILFETSRTFQSVEHRISFMRLYPEMYMDEDARFRSRAHEPSSLPSGLDSGSVIILLNHGTQPILNVTASRLVSVRVKNMTATPPVQYQVYSQELC